MKILIVQLRQLGDILLTTPVIRALKAHYPESQISFLTHPMGKLVLDGNPLLHELLCVPTTGIVDEAKFAYRLRQKRFDVVFDFMGNPRSALWTWLSGASRRVGFDSARAWAYTQTAPRISGDDYIVLEKFRLIAVDGMKSEDVRLMLGWGQKEYETIQPWIAANRAVADAPYRIALSPTHRREARQWPAERWAELADWLSAGWGASVVWLWGPGEEEFVRDIRMKCQGSTMMAPKTTFRELAALIAQCDLFVGTSNGPSHVAVAVNTPSLQLHGPTDAPSWSPMTDRHQVVAEQRMDAISIVAVQKKLMSMRPIVAREVTHHGRVVSSEAVWTVRPQL